jgi:cytochrome c oxidase subunit 2
VRRGTTVRLVAFTLALGAIAFAIAFFIPWLPDQASKEREGIDFVFWLTAGICLGIFGLVAAMILYAVVKFRRRPDDDSDGAPIHGHTGLEIVWTAIPAVLVTVIAAASGVVLVQNDRPDKGYLNVRVTAQQFAWQFSYPEAGDLAATQLRLPVGRSVKLRLTARDVIHSFWVPEFGQKIDAVPGQDTELVITPTKIGDYPVICTELCGLGHALMRTRAIVMTQEDFAGWLKDQQRQREGPPGEAGKAVFDANGCGSCHTLKAAGTTGTAGPDLDDLPALAEKAGKPLEEFVRESIVEPDAYVEPGFNPGVMPPFAQLPEDQLDALVQYLVESSKGNGS